MRGSTDSNRVQLDTSEEQARRIQQAIDSSLAAAAPPSRADRLRLWLHTSSRARTALWLLSAVSV